MDLCICNMDEPPGKNIDLQSLVGHKTEIERVKPCLRLLRRSFSENGGKEDFVGVKVYEFANVCRKKTFEVTLTAKTANVRASTELPVTIKLSPRTIYFATVMVTEHGFMKPRLRLKLSISSDQHGLRERN